MSSNRYVPADRVVMTLSQRVAINVTIADVVSSFVNACSEDQAKILTLIAQQIPSSMADDPLGELASRIRPGGVTHLWLLELVAKIVANEHEGTSRPVD